MRAEFIRLVGLNAFEFEDVVPDGVNVVSVRWVFAWKVDKAGNIMKPKARLVARGGTYRRFLGNLCSYSGCVQC